MQRKSWRCGIGYGSFFYGDSDKKVDKIKRFLKRGVPNRPFKHTLCDGNHGNDSFTHGNSAECNTSCA
jgi:hypothetical protein